MSVNINSGFHCNGRYPIDSKFVLSASEMETIDPEKIPDHLFALCKDDGCIYIYNKGVAGDYGDFTKYNKRDEKRTLFGFQIDGTATDPYAAVTYLPDCDNSDFVPASMDHANEVFSYGSWKENDFFMPRPCMLKYDGTVDYYLDPNDYTKKEDGTASDVSNTSYNGNAMMEWGRGGKQIWYKVAPYNNGHSAKVYISNEKIDDTYHAWSFIGKQSNGTYSEKEHFYTNIYAPYATSNRLRSISGTTWDSSKFYISDALSYVTSNGTVSGMTAPGTYTLSTFGDHMLISFLFILMFKCTAYGKALGFLKKTSVLSARPAKGTLNKSGLFFGSSKNPSLIKIFGMENVISWFGNMRLGYCASSTHKYKLCLGQSDGSSVDGYEANTSTFSKYKNSGISAPNGGEGVLQMTYTDAGVAFPTSLKQSSYETAPYTVYGYGYLWGGNYFCATGTEYVKRSNDPDWTVYGPWSACAVSGSQDGSGYGVTYR